MSTNYYLGRPPTDRMDPRWHVAKRCSAGKGKLTWIWAMPPECAQWAMMWTDRELAWSDEYGAQFTGRQMLDLIGECDSADMLSVGQRFT